MLLFVIKSYVKVLRRVGTITKSYVLVYFFSCFLRVYCLFFASDYLVKSYQLF